MAYDTRLDRRIQDLVRDWPGTSRKKMFGGTCVLLDGNMLGGVYQDLLIVRLGEEEAARALESPHVRPFDITGRPMKGWVMVEPAALGRDEELRGWLLAARRFVETLPAK